MIGTRGRHPNNKEERWRRECIRRGNVKHAALMLHDDQTARKAKRAKLEKLLRERWEARHNDGAPGALRPAGGTSSVSAARCQLPQRGSLLNERDDLPSPLGKGDRAEGVVDEVSTDEEV